jgi:hypothetical protein
VLSKTDAPSGAAAPVAWHAAALDARIRGVATVGGLASYRSVLDAEPATVPVSGLLPGVLLRYDLPALLGALAPASTLIVNPVDAAGQPLVGEEAARAYAPAAAVHRLLGDTDGCRVVCGLERDAFFDATRSWLVTLAAPGAARYLRQRPEGRSTARSIPI